MPNLTPDQRRAIHHHADNLIVVAGAGSGKTFVLVERYLALLDRNPDWSLNALVAITFTQKAAQEMRDRVRQHLQQQADAASDADALRWASRLAAMDSARIDTIHGLCASILRANAAEAGVDPAFAVLDEIESSALLDDSIDDVFRALRPADPVLELFAEYGERPLREELKRLAPLSTQWRGDGGEVSIPPDYFTAWLADWVNDAQSWINMFWQRLSESERYMPVGDDVLSEGWRVCGDVMDWLASQSEPPLFKDSLEIVEQVAALRMPGVPSKAWGGDGIAAKDAFRQIRDSAKRLVADIGEPPGIPDRRAAQLMPLWVALAEQVRAAYRAAKDDRAALDFDDLESLTCDLLQDDSVRARYLGAEFRHVLVDEFQDTNAAQWTIIQRIADPNTPGCLFVVGDPKQSIYGFRGADVSVFNRVRDTIAVAAPPVPLATSFRTHHRLVECLNSIFARLLVRDPASLVAEFEVEFEAMAAHRAAAPSELPPLELILLDRARLDASDEDQAARRWESRVLARRIREMVEVERRPIYDKRQGVVRPVDYGDVALLFQAMSSVTVYESALKAEGIPYLTTAGKGYYDRQEVWDLLNLLRALYNPADNLSLAAALRSPLFTLSDDALLALRLSGGSLWDALNAPQHVPRDEIERVVFARDTLRALRRRAGRVTIAELLRSALETTGYLAVLTGLPDGKRRRGNVEKLLEKAESGGRVTLSAFTHYLMDMSASEVREGEAVLESEGAVQLMTVHKSKGLEFPVVVLVDASYARAAGFGGDLVAGGGCKVYDADRNKLVSTFAHRRAEMLAEQREKAERLRLLYVAATRAQDYLIVSGQVTCKPDQPIRAKGWLEGLLAALELTDIAPESQIVPCQWGDARVDFPEPPATADSYRPDPPLPAWGEAPVARIPALLQPMPSAAHAPDAPARSLTATQLADLGSAFQANPRETRPYFAERWRRSVFHDAPSRIPSARGVRQAQIGEIVHRVVRWSLPEGEADLRELLRRSAWEEGIVGDAENRAAVDGAYELLARVRRGDVFEAIAHAREIHRAVPFVYQVGQRTVHGVIDLLIQDAAGQWQLVDYKTAYVDDARGGVVTPEILNAHAQRYHLQMGVYAAAVRELVGVAPIVQIHYIRYVHTVMIRENDWNAALAQLEAYIGDAVEPH